jgi:uncharacterized Zn-finger protein
MEKLPKHCSLCIKAFRGQKEWDMHQTEAHMKGDVECEFCEKTFSHKHYLSRHAKDIHFVVQEDSTCIDCNKVFRDKVKLEKHKVHQHSAKTIHCDLCEEKFSTNNKLKIHRGRKHFKLRDFPCKECPKKFFSKTDVRTHIVQVHSDYKPYKCDMCPATFKRNTAWHTHRKTHIYEENLECPVCQKMFQSKTGLRVHLDNHRKPAQTFICTVENCDTVLTSKGGFQGHLKTHIPRERVPCTICLSTLTNNQDLKRHMRNVHENREKKFQCKICQVRTFTEQELARHMQTHSGEVFQCPMEGCKSKSNTQYGINFHVKKKHGQIKHRRPVEDIFRAREKMLECSLCDKKIRSGAAPLHTMRLHMKTHENELTIECPMGNCVKRIRQTQTQNTSYNLPIQYFNHLEKEHDISFSFIKYKPYLNASCVMESYC